MGKHNGDYTVSDMLRLDYSLWREQLGTKEEERRVMIDALQYAIKMAHVMGKDIKHWKLLSAFGTGEGVKITTNLGNINKALATYTQADEDNELLKTIERNIKNITGVCGDVSRKIAGLESNLSSYENSYRTACNQVVEYSRKIREYNQLIEDLKSREGQTPIINKLRELSSMSFFNYVRTDVGTRRIDIIFKTDKVIINQGKADEMDMGTYIVRLRLENGSVYYSVLPSEGNTTVDGYYHPYVNSSGSICFGDVSNRVGDMLREENLLGVFGILRQLLITYSRDTTPHMGLDRFLEFKNVKPFFDLSERYVSRMSHDHYLPVKLLHDHARLGKVGDVVFAVLLESAPSHPYVCKVSNSTSGSVQLHYTMIQFPESLEQAYEWHNPLATPEGATEPRMPYYDNFNEGELWTVNFNGERRLYRSNEDGWVRVTGDSDSIADSNASDTKPIVADNGYSWGWEKVDTSTEGDSSRPRVESGEGGDRAREVENGVEIASGNAGLQSSEHDSNDGDRAVAQSADADTDIIDAVRYSIQPQMQRISDLLRQSESSVLDNDVISDTGFTVADIPF